jgi:hypothetical protein
MINLAIFLQQSFLTVPNIDNLSYYSLKLMNDSASSFQKIINKSYKNDKNIINSALKYYSHVYSIYGYQL